MSSQEKRKYPWTYQELIKWATDDFAARGIDTPRLDAELLLAHAFGLRRVDLYLRFDQRAEPEEGLDLFRDHVRRRREREPAALILGSSSFHDIELAAPPGVFLPRPETEIMVDEAIEILRPQDPREAPVLDLCSGGGALALALAKALPGLQVSGVDISADAVRAARANADALGLSGRAVFIEGDLFGPLGPDRRYAAITCNPPYIPSGEIEGLMPEVRDFDPRAALDGGPDGLGLVRRAIGEAPSRLRPGGHLLFEIGEGQARAVEALAGARLVHVKTRKDLAGIERIVIFRFASG